MSDNLGTTQPNTPVSEDLGSTQPNTPVSENPGSTQPNIPIKKRSTRGRTFLFNALGLIVILVLAILAGYGAAMTIRTDAENSGRAQELGDQFQYALVDIEFGRYANARQRLEYIIDKDPSFPGAQEKLTEVLVLSNAPTVTPTASLVPTPDFTGAEQAFLQAQQLVAAQDWPGALGALDQIRKLDATYKTSQVDGMYYFALRNYGYNLVVKEGNLEGGIYQFTLAERFGPLDRDAAGLREGARYYLIGASFWELDWQKALSYFTQAAGYNFWDGTFTTAQRLHYAYMRYGDQLYEGGDPCGAVPQYEAAEAIAALDEAAGRGYSQSYQECYPATEVPTVTATSGVTQSAPTNAAPTVSAGSEQTVNLADGASLDGTVSDDGLPNPPGTVTASWSLVSGPGDVTFGDASAVDTTASFTAGGAYTLRLTANDGELSASADVVITVNP
jgi:tetratricopeptide (TPR) repeat protein